MYYPRFVKVYTRQSVEDEFKGLIRFAVNMASTRMFRKPKSGGEGKERIENAFTKC